MKQAFLIIFCTFFTVFTQTSDVSDLFNTHILKNPDTVQSILMKKNFSKIFFTTKDNIKLCGLYLDQHTQQPVKGTIIFSAGFYPGTKEGIATFYGMLADQPYNFLFFDARGHKESEGSLFSYSNLKQYGQSEYQDIIAAIDFVDQHNQQNNISQNIILHGLCSGAFHCVKAYDAMKTTQHTACNHIKGIIFDSGWNKISNIVETTIQAEVHHRLKNSYFSLFEKPLSYTLNVLYRTFLKSAHNNIASIDDSIASISCPILFIHSLHDSYIPIKEIEPLVQKSTQPTTWWPETDSHATCHLKEKNMYQQKLKQFLNQA